MATLWTLMPTQQIFALMPLTDTWLIWVWPYYGCPQFTTGKKARVSAMRLPTAKKSLPWDGTKLHGKE
jgi:hypothetical protein